MLNGIFISMKLSRTHRRHVLAITLCITFLLSVGVGLARADYKSGLDAFNAGTYDQALIEWKKAALDGDKRAQHALGLLLQSGRGTKPDIVQALKWYEAAAAQGFAPAMNNLAMLYADGVGVKKDEKKAIDYWIKAADSGNATAQFNLGVQYMLGHGVQVDKKQTVQLWTKAAEAKHAQAQYNLGLLFDRGDGIPKDEKQAAHWIAQAAENGLAEAQIDLAEFYQTGHGVAKNPDQAYTWLEKAAATGNLKAKQKLTELPEPVSIVVAAEPGLTKEHTSEAKPLTDHGTVVPGERYHAADTAHQLEIDQQTATARNAATLEASDHAPNTAAESVEEHDEEQQLATSEVAESREEAAETFTDEESAKPESHSEEAHEAASVAGEAVGADGVQPEIPVAETLSPHEKQFHIWLDERGTNKSAQTQFSNLKLQLRPDLDRSMLSVRPFVSASGTVYRIYVGPYSTLKSAQEMCDKIRARVSGQFCRTVIN